MKKLILVAILCLSATFAQASSTAYGIGQLFGRAIASEAAKAAAKAAAKKAPENIIVLENTKGDVYFNHKQQPK